jgi:hypothetical protein
MIQQIDATQQTKPPLRRLFWWLGGFAALVAVVLAMSAWRASHTAMRRYVSPPQKGGIRYTFLYPKALGQAHDGIMTLYGPDGKSHSDLEVTIVASPTPFQRLLWRLHLSAPVPIQDREWVRLSLEDTFQDAYLAHPTGRVTASDGRFVRQENSNNLPNNIGGHDVIILDSRLHTRCLLRHIYESVRSRDGFAAADAQMAASFQALSPGAPIPSH